MVLYHVTHRRNIASIDTRGLLPAKSTGKEQAVWLVSRSLVPWALGHTAAKRGRGPITKLVVYRCEVARSKVRRFARGTWRCFEVVKPTGMEPSSAWTDTYPHQHPH